MTFRRRTLAAAVLCAALAAAVLTACTPQATPTPTPTPHFTSDQQAYAAAEQTYRNYVDATNAIVVSDPGTFEEVYRWETGDALASDRKALSAYHADRVKREGESVITLMEPGSVSPDFGTVKLSVCLDVSSIQLTDASGKSLVSPTRGNVHSTTVELTKAASSPTGLLVSGIGGRDGAPAC